MLDIFFRAHAARALQRYRCALRAQTEACEWYHPSRSQMESSGTHPAALILSARVRVYITVFDRR